MKAANQFLLFTKEYKVDWVKTVATYLCILIYVLITSQIYVTLGPSLFESNIYNTFEALGALSMGFLSDKFSRRKMALLSHLIGICLLPFILMGKDMFFAFLLFGFFYNPLPILRAGLIDNLSHFSKIKIVAFSFVIQYLPWAFYNLFFDIQRHQAFVYAAALLGMSLIITYFFFFDKRDFKGSKAHELNHYRPIHENAYKKFYYTIAAAIPAQLVYFFSSNYLEKDTQDALFYSILSFGSLIGALVASLYKKTPHVAVLTINYGINMVLASIPISCLLIYNFQEVSFPLMFIIFGCLGGFGIPFVYDVILNATFVRYRGTACGLLDAIFSLSSLVNLFLVRFLELNILWTLSIIPLCFILSTFLQKRSEQTT